MDFYRSLLPWAYLALLNSRVFEAFTEYFCPRVQGGQFNLSKRFIDRVFLPDLSDVKYVTDATLDRLASMGRAIHEGGRVDEKLLDQISARAYRITLNDLEPNQ